MTTQERNYVSLGLAEANWFVTMLVFFLQATLAHAQIMASPAVKTRRKSGEDFKRTNQAGSKYPYFALAVVSLVSQGFSTMSLRYVNYPTNASTVIVSNSFITLTTKRTIFGIITQF